MTKESEMTQIEMREQEAKADTTYVTPIAVELLVREAQSLRGYPAGDRRTKRLVEVIEELVRLGAGAVLDQIEDEDEDDLLRRKPR